jgi:hypothetical protein
MISTATHQRCIRLGQNNAEAAREWLARAEAARNGPGSVLKKMLARLGINAAGNCRCSRRAAEMDRQGPDWCAANVATIVDWLAEEAGRRGLCFSPVAARWLIRVAIARSRVALERSIR